MVLFAFSHRSELNKVNKYNTDFVDFKITIQEKSLFHWILKFAISLIQNSLNLNPTNLNSEDFSMVAYKRELIKAKSKNN